jgi:hypothetical protein
MEILAGNVPIFNFRLNAEIKEEDGGAGFFSRFAGNKSYTAYNIQTVVSKDQTAILHKAN